MSSTNSLSPRAATPSVSARGPAGLGVSKVAWSIHQSCHRSSMSCARPAVYRWGGASSPAVGEVVTSLIPADQPTSLPPPDPAHLDLLAIGRDGRRSTGPNYVPGDGRDPGHGGGRVRRSR